MIVAGTLAGAGKLNVFLVILAAWAGAVIGDNISYGIGKFAGERTVKRPAVDPGASQVIALDWVDGSQETFSNLGQDGAFVDKDYAKRHDLEMGSTSTSPSSTASPSSSGSRASSTRPQAARRSGPSRSPPPPGMQNNSDPQNLYSFVKMEGGETDANLAALDKASSRTRTPRRSRGRTSSTARSPVSARS